VYHVLLAQALLALRVEEVPGPVRGLVDLFGGLGVAFEAHLGDRRAIREVALQLAEFRVIRGRGGARLRRDGIGGSRAGRADRARRAPRRRAQGESWRAHE